MLTATLFATLTSTVKEELTIGPKRIRPSLARVHPRAPLEAIAQLSKEDPRLALGIAAVVGILLTSPGSRARIAVVREKLAGLPDANTDLAVWVVSSLRVRNIPGVSLSRTGEDLTLTRRKGVLSARASVVPHLMRLFPSLESVIPSGMPENDATPAKRLLIQDEIAAILQTNPGVAFDRAMSGWELVSTNKGLAIAAGLRRAARALAADPANSVYYLDKRDSPEKTGPIRYVVCLPPDLPSLELGMDYCFPDPHGEVLNLRAVINLGETV